MPHLPNAVVAGLKSGSGRFFKCRRLPPQAKAPADEGSAEEVAKKTTTDVETVRKCTDLWRRTMNAAHPSSYTWHWAAVLMLSPPRS